MKPRLQLWAHRPRTWHAFFARSRAWKPMWLLGATSFMPRWRPYRPQRCASTRVAEVQADPALPVTLVMAVYKFDHMEWAIEKATELGVAGVAPVIAQRTEKHLGQPRINVPSGGGALCMRRPSSRAGPMCR